MFQHLSLMMHDESVFYQNDIHKTHWIANTSGATPLPKGDGQSIMISDFLTSEWGHLVDEMADGVLESVSILWKSTLYWLLFQGRKGHLQARCHLWWLFHCRKPAGPGWLGHWHFEGKTGGKAQGLFLFDNAPSHQIRAANALSARKMPKGIFGLDFTSVRLIMCHTVPDPTGHMLRMDQGCVMA